MTPSSGNRFEDFFADDAYVFLKNHLYNYLLRRRAVRKSLQPEMGGMILEVGSGLSPMTETSDRIVYSELSFTALRTLKSRQGRGYYVVADATHLPFKIGSFSQVICSEVLEHLPEDRLALCEIASVMIPGGSLILTFPHRRSYFACDDRFVNHFRRYELHDMEALLRETGLNPLEIKKILGPMEKLTMVFIITGLSWLQRMRGEKRDPGGNSAAWRVISSLFEWCNRLYYVPIWLDAQLAPLSLAAVLLIRAVKLR